MLGISHLRASVKSIIFLSNILPKGECSLSTPSQPNTSPASVPPVLLFHFLDIKTSRMSRTQESLRKRQLLGPSQVAARSLTRLINLSARVIPTLGSEQSWGFHAGIFKDGLISPGLQELNLRCALLWNGHLSRGFSGCLTRCLISRTEYG